MRPSNDTKPTLDKRTFEHGSESFHSFHKFEYIGTNNPTRLSEKYWKGAIE